MTTPPNQPPAQSGQRILGDLPCKHCGYNLRTLLLAGRCPECGAAVADTLAQPPQAPPLEASDGAWLRTLVAGCIVLCLSIAIPAICYMWLRRNASVLWSLPGHWPRLSLMHELRSIAAVCGVVGSFYGLYLLSGQEPKRLVHQYTALSLRGCALMFAASTALAAGLYWIGFYTLSPAPFASLEELSQILFGITLLLTKPLGTLLIYVYMHRLLKRCRFSHSLPAEAIFLCLLTTLILFSDTLPTLGGENTQWRATIGFGDPLLLFDPGGDPLRGLALVIWLWVLSFWARSAIILTLIARPNPAKWFRWY